MTTTDKYRVVDATGAVRWTGPTLREARAEALSVRGGGRIQRRHGGGWVAVLLTAPTTTTEDWRTAHAFRPGPKPWRGRVSYIDVPPFRTKAGILRVLRAGDRLELVHHRLPDRSRVATILRVSTYQVALSSPEGSESYIEWPAARYFRVTGGRSFSLLEPPTGDAVEGPAWISFRLIG